MRDRMERLAKTVIVACSSLREYVAEAQRQAGTDHPVYWLDRTFHRDPNEMREHVDRLLHGLPEEIQTVLVVMGFCGGSWDGISAPCRMVLPKIDDCVSLLLQTGDTPKSDLKEPKHLYVRAYDPAEESFRAIFERLTADRDEETKKRFRDDWKRYYDRISIIDTGINDCRRPGYYETVRRDAEWLDAETEYVTGGIHLITKLLKGKWDAQFLVLEPGECVVRERMLIELQQTC